MRTSGNQYDWNVPDDAIPWQESATVTAGPVGPVFSVITRTRAPKKPYLLVVRRIAATVEPVEPANIPSLRVFKTNVSPINMIGGIFRSTVYEGMYNEQFQPGERVSFEWSNVDANARCTAVVYGYLVTR